MPLRLPPPSRRLAKVWRQARPRSGPPGHRCKLACLARPPTDDARVPDERGFSRSPNHLAATWPSQQARKGAQSRAGGLIGSSFSSRGLGHPIFAWPSRRACTGEHGPNRVVARSTRSDEAPYLAHLRIQHVPGLGIHQQLHAKCFHHRRRWSAPH